MKKKLMAGLIIAFSAFAIIGCGEATEDPDLPTLVTSTIDGKGQGTTTKPSVPEGSGNVVEINGIPTIGERVEVDGMFQSYLTGEWKPVEVAKRRPMAVMVPNNKSSLPQYGVSKASIIFEAPMEWLSCTRLMCVFEDYDELDHIGSVRSSRAYFLFPAMAWDAIYCNWGLAVPLAGPILNSDRIDNISASVYGIENPSDEAFERDEDRKKAGYATEYTGIMTISGYNQAVSRQGYRTTYNDDFEPMINFAAEGTKVTYDDQQDATKISPGGVESGKSGGGYESGMPYFVYDAKDHLYHRYQFGEAQIDEMNDTELTCSNVVFIVTRGAYVTEESGYLAFDMESSGTAYVFTEGKFIPAAWSKGTPVEKSTNDKDQYNLYSIYGGELVLNQGKTWICLIWDEYEDLITIE